MELKDFEAALKRLEEIVGALETGEMSLEESLKLFEEGVQISRFCSAKLEDAERRVEILLQDQKGQMKETPFELSSEDTKVD